jgi:glycosyltransferase involved in cell wall biosynthesis
MNICLVSQEYPPETARGGIGTQTWNKARALACLGHTVHVLSCANGPGPDLRTATDAGVIVHRMQSPGIEFPVYKIPTYWLGYTWSVLRQLHHLMRMTTFDVIDFPEYGAEGFAYLLDRSPWNWVPVVVQFHGSLAMFVEHIGWPEKESEFHRVGTWMEGVAIKQADALMACSASIADFTAGYYDLPRSTIDVIHCGVDAEAFCPAGERRADGRPTVLFVGNIAANKGIRTVFEAVLRIRSRYPDVRLQILGEGDRNLVREFQAQAGSKGALASVEYHGFIGRDRLPEFFRSADVFCAPSQYEAFGIVYIEAMACGCPVIASATGGTPEAVLDGQTGVLVPADNVAAVVAALDRILGDAPLRRRMGEASRQRVENYFAMDKYIQRVLAVYQKAIDRSRQTLDRLKGQTG